MHEDHVFEDPQLKERGFFVPITAPEVGTYLYPSTTFRMSNVPFEVRKPPVRLGEDNDYVYREVLGLTEEEYDRLKAQGPHRHGLRSAREVGHRNLVCLNPLILSLSIHISQSTPKTAELVGYRI